MTDSFWAGGPEAYADGLREHYEPKLGDLRKRREDAEGTERAALDAEIERLEAEYKSKLDSIDDCLFWLTRLMGGHLRASWGEYLSGASSPDNMVFALRPSAHRCRLFKALSGGRISRSSGIARLVQGGVVNTFRCRTSVKGNA